MFHSIQRAFLIITIRELEEPWANDYQILPHERQANLDAITGFVISTLNGLIEEETSLLGSTSLSTFARLDIGIMPDEDGKAQFFVNELERLPSVVLWRGDERVLPVARVFEESLYEYGVTRSKERARSSSPEL